jgi:hypothetical protein
VANLRCCPKIPTFSIVTVSLNLIDSKFRTTSCAAIYSLTAVIGHVIEVGVRHHESPVCTEGLGAFPQHCERDAMQRTRQMVDRLQDRGCDDLPVVHRLSVFHPPTVQPRARNTACTNLRGVMFDQSILPSKR